MRILILLLLFFWSIFNQGRLFAQTEDDIKKEAHALFNDEKYVEATPLYLRLLSLQPRDANYNYRYGTCLLYNSDNKSSAFKYLNYAVSVGGVEDEAYYFLGKAYHLTFQFNKAIANYSKYQQRAGDRAIRRLRVDRQIEMCVNAKSLISTISDLVVVSKKQVDYNSFFRLYDLSNIGGTLIVTEEFQSKEDEKQNHLPLIHYPSEPKRIYYSSYGDKGNDQKDIYTRTRLPDNTWSLPQKVSGFVNTGYDEDFPYMHPDGNYLYFCSKGHNSMGGYDIFRAPYNNETNSFGRPENMDYAISSPDNDLFYIVDSLNKYAYFASQRESEDGKVHVYEVRVERFPVQIVIIKGEFKSEIHPENTSLDIEVYSAASNELVGTFKTDRRGGYLINLPKGGKYEFRVKTQTGENQFKQIVDVPYLKEFKPLKQRIEEFLKEDANVLKVTNLFNEEFNDPGAVMAEIIQKKAQLLPNAGAYDLDSLDQLKEANKVLAQMGLQNFSALELKDLVVSKKEDLKQKEQNLKTAIIQNSNKKARLISEINTEYSTIKTTLQDLENILDTDDKTEKQNEIYADIQRVEDKMNQLNAIAILNEKLSDVLSQTQVVVKLATELSDAYTEAKEADKNLALLEHKEYVKESLLKEERVEVNSILQPVLDQELKKVNELTNRIGQIESKIKSHTNKVNQLEQEIQYAKKKEQAAIKSEIDVKKAEIELFQEELDFQSKQSSLLENAIVLTAAKNSIQSLNLENGDVLSDTQQKVGVSTADIQKIRTELEQKSEKDNTETTLDDEKKEEIEALLTVASTFDFDSQEEGQSQDEIEQSIRSTQKIIEDLERSLEENELDKDLESRVKEKIERLKESLEKRTDILDDKEVLVAEIDQKQLKEAKELAVLSNELLNSFRLGESTADDVKKKLSPYKEKLKKTQKDLKEEIKNKGTNAQRSKELSFLQNEILSVEKSIAMLDRITMENELKNELVNNLLSTKSTLAKQDPSLDVIKAQITVSEDILEVYQNALSETREALQLSPNEQSLKQREWILKDLIQINESEKEDLNKKLKDIESTTEIEPLEIPELAETELAAALSSDYLSKRNSTLEAYEKQEISTEEYLALVATTRASNTEKKEAFEEEKTVLVAELVDLKQITEPTTDQKIRIQELELDLAILNQKTTFIASEQNKLAALKAELEIEIEEQIELVENGENDSITQVQDKLKIDSNIENKRATQLLLEEKELTVLYDLGELSTVDFIKYKKGLRTDLLDEIQFEKATQVIKESTIQNLQEEVRRISVEIGGLEATFIEKQEECEEKASEYVAQLKQESLNNADMLNEPVEGLDISDLKQLEKEINEFASILNKEKEQVGTAGSLDLKTEINTQIDTELNNLNNKKRQVYIEIGALESISEMRERTDYEANEKELKKLEKAIRAYEVQKANLDEAILNENGIVKEEEKLVKVQNELLEQEVSIIQNNQSKEPTTYVNQALNIYVDNQIIALENVKNPTAKNEKLKEIKSAQEKLLVELEKQEKAALKTMLIEELNTDIGTELLREENALLSNTDIENQNVQLRLKHIELEEQIEFLVGDYKDDKQTELSKEDQNYLSALENAKTELTLQIENNQRVLATRSLRTEEDNYRGIEPEALSTEITYNKEVELASSPVYKEVRTAMNSLDQLKFEVNIKRNSLESKRTKLSDLIALQVENKTTKVTREIDSLLTDILQIEKELIVLRRELKNEQDRINGQIATLSENQAEIENLLLRDVAPILTQEIKQKEKLASVSLGLEIGTEVNEIKREEAISLANEIPDGVVFRVQIGAFNRPVDKNTFNEFNPLSGEQVRPGLIRYMAGIFATKRDARRAEASIRQLGYSDAFVVAYCDGQRIPVYRAEQLLASGACVSKIAPIDAVLVENGIPITQPTLPKVEEPKQEEFSYNQSENSAPAEAVESKNGLFFTVQVGVYNRPVTREQLFDISPLVTLRLPNGQIRYSTGMYNSVNEARPKLKDAIERGVSDAFITAYYKGERVGASKAKQLLAEFGTTILESNQPKMVPSEKTKDKEALPEVTSAYVLKDEQQVKLISKESYESYPTQVLNRYNETGIRFYYDSYSQKVQSGLISTTEIDKVLLVEDEFTTTPFFKGEKIVNPKAIDRKDAVETKVQYVLNVRILGDKINPALAEAILSLELPWEISKEASFLTLKIGTAKNEEVLMRIKQNLLQFNVAEMTISVLKSNEF